MAIELVTGYQGKDHVTAEQWADFNRGIFGDAAILPVGNRMEVAIQTANQISVKDGVAVFDGRQVYIGYGESENIAITSGTQGMLRRDIVVLEYTREEETGVESVQFKVINGIPASSNAKDPSVQDMDIRTGVFVSQKPFCRVRLNGTAIEGVDSLVQVKEFKPHAFADPVNNLTGTDPRLPLAATQGVALEKMIDAINSALTVKKYTSESQVNGFESTALVQGNVVTFKIRGSAAQTLGTKDGYTYCGTFTQLKPLLTENTSKIKRIVVAPKIGGQLRYDPDTGYLRIGYTHDWTGEPVVIPAETAFYLEETFVL